MKKGVRVMAVILVVVMILSIVATGLISALS